MPQRHILFITQHFWPELIGSGPYCRDIAERLVADGDSVSVLTCRPHYPEGEVPPAYQYGQRDSETYNGVAIERTGAWLANRRGALGRLLSEFAFLVRGIAALITGRISRADKVITLCPSIFSVLLGVLACRRSGRHIALVHDIQSGLAAGLSMVRSNVLVGVIRWLERLALNRVDAVLVLSEEMRRYLHDIGVRAPIEILPLWVDLEAVIPRPPIKGHTVVALYSGNFGRKQGLDQILGAASIAKGRSANIVFRLRGNGSELESLIDTARQRKLDNVKFSPLLSAKNFTQGLSEGDIHLVPQNPNVADFAVPSKIFSIMAAGRPFVATARPGSLLWKLREESEAFLCVPAGDIDAFADAIEDLASSHERRTLLGNNGREYVSARHDKRAILGRFSGLLMSDKHRNMNYARRAVAPTDI